MRIGRRRQKLINWPPLEEVENLRWANNHTQYRSTTYGFCEAQDCCEVCDSRMRINGTTELRMVGEAKWLSCRMVGCLFQSQ